MVVDGPVVWPWLEKNDPEKGVCRNREAASAGGPNRDRLPASLVPKSRHMQLFGAIRFQLLAELAFPALERDHLPLRRFHEAAARQLSLLLLHARSRSCSTSPTPCGTP